LNVRQPHDHVVHTPAEIARQDAQRRAQQPSNTHRGQPHQQRDPRAVEQTRQHVTSQRIRAEDKFHFPCLLALKRRLEAQDQVDAVGVFGRQLRGEDCHRYDDHQDEQGQHRPARPEHAAHGAPQRGLLTFAHPQREDVGGGGRRREWEGGLFSHALLQ